MFLYSFSLAAVAFAADVQANDSWQWTQDLTLEHGQASRTVLDDGRKSAQQLFYVPAVRVAIDSRWQLFGNAYVRSGRQLTSVVGDVQGVSNIDADELTKLGELYAQFETRDWLVKIGRQDENSVLALSDVASQFSHSSMGYSPTMNGLVSYPDAEWMIAARHQLTEQFTVQLGQTEQRSTAELWWQPNWQGQSQHTVKAGYWYHQDLRGFGGQGAAHHPYIIWDANWSTRWASFVQYAPARASTGDITRHIGFGVRAKLSNHSNATTIGLGYSQANLAKVATELGSTQGRETAYETYVQVALNDYLTINPVLQYIQQPGGEPEAASTWVGLLRLYISY